MSQTTTTKVKYDYSVKGGRGWGRTNKKTYFHLPYGPLNPLTRVHLSYRTLQLPGSKVELRGRESVYRIEETLS